MGSMDTEARRGPVDRDIVANEGDWAFDAQVAQNFDEHIRKSVPFYDEIQSMVLKLSEWFVRDNSVIYDLGSATGETISRLTRRYAGRKVKFVAVDSSKDMMEQARRKVQAENVVFHANDVMDEKIRVADLVICLYTLQFLKIKDRRKVLRTIFQGLDSGGAAIIVEKIRGESSLFEAIWTELYSDYKLRGGLTEKQILQKACSIRGIVRPLTLKENIDMLEKTGFKQIDVFFKWCNYAGMLAVKS